jgi:GNAT superfamily N-acetyltransferase
MASEACYRIRPPTSGETAKLAAILAAMERHYDATLSDDEATAAAARLLGGSAPARCLVAASTAADGHCIGIALFAPLFPGARFRDVMVLKDLFVLPEARGKGVARALVAAVAQAAIDAGCERLDWMADRGNELARAAYRAMGAAEGDKVTYSVKAQGLARLAATGHADPRGRRPSRRRGTDPQGSAS